MTAPRPTAFLPLLAAGPLDVGQVANALSIPDSTAQSALLLLEKTGTVQHDAAWLWTLTDAGRAQVAQILTDEIDPAGAAKSLLASIDAGLSASSVPGYVTVARVEHGVTTWTHPDAAPGLVASLCERRAQRDALTASAEDATAAAFAHSYPSPWPVVRRPVRSRASSRPAATRPASERLARARALVAASAPTTANDALADAPDGTVIAFGAPS